jgi:hypothetical protein
MREVDLQAARSTEHLDPVEVVEVVDDPAAADGHALLEPQHGDRVSPAPLAPVVAKVAKRGGREPLMAWTTQSPAGSRYRWRTMAWRARKKAESPQSCARQNAAIACVSPVLSSSLSLPYSPGAS